MAGKRSRDLTCGAIAVGTFVLLAMVVCSRAQSGASWVLPSGLRCCGVGSFLPFGRSLAQAPPPTGKPREHSFWYRWVVSSNSPMASALVARPSGPSGLRFPIPSFRDPNLKEPRRPKGYAVRGLAQEQRTAVPCHHRSFAGCRGSGACRRGAGGGSRHCLLQQRLRALAGHVVLAGVPYFLTARQGDGRSRQPLARHRASDGGC